MASTQTSSDHDGASDDQSAIDPFRDDHQTIDSSTESTKLPVDFVPHDRELSQSISSNQDHTSQSLVETEANEPVVASPNDEGQQSSPTYAEIAGNGPGTDSLSANVGNSRKPTRRPRQISGRRNPKLGKQDKSGAKRKHFRPELVCRKVPVSEKWEIVLCADDECPVSSVRFEDEPLDFKDRQCHIPALRGRLAVRLREGEERDIALFEGSPLIFKLGENWNGEGRKIARITNGHFIVVAPATWERKGHTPVEPGGCTDSEFRAHYFYRDATMMDINVGGFGEWGDSLASTGMELVGQRIFDNSDNGELFVGFPPSLKPSPDIEWARVGEETSNGWGQDFQPGKESLRDILNSREGHFFLRAYDSKVNMLDSIEFRYLHNLERIEVNGEEYSENTALVPMSLGYPPASISFIGADSNLLTPALHPDACQTVTASGNIRVRPSPEEDHISCNMDGVEIVIKLPRIWWRLEDNMANPGEWQDTPLTMTRKKFREIAISGVCISLRSKRFSKVHAGFDGEEDRLYSRKKKEDCISIPLEDFVDRVQISDILIDDTDFNTQLAVGKIVSIIAVSADPMPKIVSFSVDPKMTIAGEKAILQWTTQNTSNARAAIDPDVGEVKSDGTCTVCPTATTRYTLSLSAPGVDNINRSVTITVDSPPRPGVQPVARVKSRAAGWRKGKGFSAGEIREAGLTEAIVHSLRIDRRRRTLHRNLSTSLRQLIGSFSVQSPVYGWTLVG